MDVKKVSKVLSKMENAKPSMLDHCERTAVLCYALGKEIDLEPEELEIVWMAGYLHEVGKIDFESNIQLREEFVDLEKIYPYFTVAILNNYEGFESLMEIIMQHQENIDGSGYPKGLHHEQINLLAIIIRICDFYDKTRINGATHDDACKELRLQSDIIFPRRIITPFIKSVIKNELHFEYDQTEETEDDLGE